MGAKRLTPDSYYNLAIQRGFIWLGPFVKSKEHTSWSCSERHIWKATYDSVQGGNGCPHCGGHGVKTAFDYADLAKKHNLIWLGPPVKMTKDKTQWQCNAGHVWSSSFNKIQTGYGCIICAGKQKKTPQDYVDLARRRGFTWLGSYPRNSRTKTQWLCSTNHEWAATYTDLDSSGNGCPHCARMFPKNESDYHALAQSRSYEWIAEKLPANVGTKSLWRCQAGHEWQGRFSDIQNGVSCPHCQDIVNGAAVSKPQRAICKMLDGELNYPIKRYKIDVALLPGKIAVEYDCAFYHNAMHDQKRDAYLIEQGWRILRIKSGTKLPTQEQLDDALTTLLAGATYAEIILDDWRE